MSIPREITLKQVEQLISKLENVLPYPWSNLESWIASSLPVIRRSFPDDLEQFSRLVQEPPCPQAPWVEGMPHTDYGPTRERLAHERQRAICEFLKQLRSIVEDEIGSVHAAEHRQPKASDADKSLVSDIEIFISHSSRDSELAKALVDIFRAALNLQASRIRCTSVNGYKLEVGANTNEQLRKETVEARVLVGLITDVSIDSAYVLFELGARWGAREFLAPLLGAGRGPEILAGPLSGLNALLCTREDLFQLVADIATQLGKSVERPEVYSTLIDSAVKISTELAAQRGLDSETNSTERPATRSESLSDFECEYLITMSRPRNEGFFYGGLDERKGREAARYQDAVHRFNNLGLVSYSNGGYRYTTQGWRLCDQLWELKILDALRFNSINDEDEIRTAVELTDGDSELEELRRLLDGMEERSLVRLSKTRGGYLVQITESGLTHRKHRPLSL